MKYIDYNTFHNNSIENEKLNYLSLYRYKKGSKTNDNNFLMWAPLDLETNENDELFFLKNEDLLKYPISD